MQAITICFLGFFKLLTFIENVFIVIIVKNKFFIVEKAIKTLLIR